MATLLTIKNLHSQIEDKLILQGVNLTVAAGRVVALMGKNGSGKSTLAHVLMGNPDYQVTAGKVFFTGKNILNLSSDERARLGMFLAFQYPYEIPGLSVYHFLQTATQAVRGKKFNSSDFKQELKSALIDLKLSENFLQRGLNEGFSGGEKKRLEILQLKILRPKLAILDETDSGLDIDALKLVASNVQGLVKKGMAALVITHYQRLLNFLPPNQVQIMQSGKIVKSGSGDLVKKLERQGYDWLEKKN